MLNKIKEFLERKKTEKKAKELYIRYEDLEREELKKLEEKAKVLEIARLMRENMIQRKEIEKLKEHIRVLEEKLKKEQDIEEKKAIEYMKRIKKMREINILFYSNPPVQVLPFDTNYPFLSPEGNHCRFLVGFKLKHIPGLNEPYVYPLLGVKQIKKVKQPKKVYRLIMPENKSRLSRFSEFFSEPDILVYSLRYGTPISVNAGEYVIENSKNEESLRFILAYKKPISVINGDTYFKGMNGEKLKYLVGFELSNSRLKEPLIFPLLSSEPVKYKQKNKVYTLHLKDSEIYLSELFTIFLEREKMIKQIIKNKPVKLSITSEGVFVKDVV